MPSSQTPKPKSTNKLAFVILGGIILMCSCIVLIGTLAPKSPSNTSPTETSKESKEEKKEDVLGLVTSKSPESTNTPTQTSSPTPTEITTTPSPTLEPTSTPSPTTIASKVPTIIVTKKPVITSTPKPIITTIKPTQAPVSKYSCAIEKTCTQMNSCEEAYYHLNVCGYKKRDGDNDGIPCEDICR